MCLNDVLHLMKHVENAKIKKTLQLSVTQETSVPVLVQRKTLDQRQCMQ